MATGGGGSGVGESVEWYRVLVTGIPTNSNREVSVFFYTAACPFSCIMLCVVGVCEG